MLSRLVRTLEDKATPRPVLPLAEKGECYRFVNRLSGLTRFDAAA